MKSIQGRLLLILSCGLAVALTAGGAAVYWIARAGMVRQLDAGLLSRAQVLSALASIDEGLLDFEFDSGPLDVGDGHFEFRSASGTVVRRSPGLEGWSLPARIVDDEEPIFADVDLPGGRAGRAVWLVFEPRIEPRDEDDPPGAAEAGAGQEEEIVGEEHDEEEEPESGSGRAEPLIVIAAVDRGPTDAALTTLLAAILGAGGVVALTIAGLVVLAVRWGLAPLVRLGTQLGSVSAPTISRRFDAQAAPGELMPVYRELNRMLDRVETALERERSFANAAAHELRTPLAELRSTAEVAVRWPDLDRGTAALRELLAIGGEMERLVESLLLLSRGQVGAAAPVALEPVVRECLERSANAIGTKGLDLRVDLDRAGTFRATREAVEIIVRNLLDNAVEYTPERGGIRITSAQTNGTCSLVVENGPVTMVEAEVDRIFEPFFRLDRARGDRAHVGLGLTVARRIAGAMGLRIDAVLAGDRLRMQVSAAK